MTGKLIAAVVTIAGLASLAAGATWAVTARDDHRQARHGPAMMGYGGHGVADRSLGGMMGYGNAGADPVQSLDEARARAQDFAGELGLEAGEVMEFTNHYYVELLDENGRPATELLVSPQTGWVQIEHGPAMMWNTEYGMGTLEGDWPGMMGPDSGGMMGGGMMSGMMGGGMMGGGSGDGGMMGPDSGIGGMMDGGMMGAGSGDCVVGGVFDGPIAAGEAELSAKEAVAAAKRWLSARRPELTAGEAEAFPGYYTIHTLRAGRVAGMLSVHAATGAVWYHSWHGRFVAMTE